MPDDLYIKKESINVTIFMRSGEKTEGQIFVALSSRFHPGRETVYELLSNDEPFVIVKSKEDVYFVDKDYIKKILISDEEIKKVEGVKVKSEKCSIEFANREMMDCLIRFEPQPYKFRLSDFLNQAPQFFSVYSEDKLFLVNRNQVISIISER